MVFYYGFDSKLDQAIANTIKPFGYKRWASGFEHGTNVRDIAFEKRVVKRAPKERSTEKDKK